MDAVTAKFRSFISFIHPDSEILLAVSGGIDSMVMADLFLKSEIRFRIAHCNFQLRNTESDADELFVKRYADESNILFISKKFDVKDYMKLEKVSLQVAARKLRYNWFEEVCEAGSLRYVATAHHAGDNLETMLMNFVHGRGIHALAGIPSVSGKVIRPLLRIGKEEIILYARENSIKWREDASNTSNDYERNYFRNNIIPLLKSVNPSIESSLLNVADDLKRLEIHSALEFDKWRKKFVKEEGNKIQVDVTKGSKHPLWGDFLFRLLNPLNFPSAVIRKITSDENVQPGSRFSSPSHHIIFARGNFTIVPSVQKLYEQYYLEANSVLETPSFTMTVKEVLHTEINFGDENIAFLNAGLLEFPLTVRRWKSGDYFFPFGMPGRKKLSDFFIDNKVSVIDKEEAWIVESKGKIVWIAGMRPDNRYRVSGDEPTIIKITFAKHG